MSKEFKKCSKCLKKADYYFENEWWCNVCKPKKEQNYCLQCKKNPIKGELIHFCGDSCIENWLKENVSPFRNYITKEDGSSEIEEGTQCNKCKQKIDDYYGSNIDTATVSRLTKHFENCSSEPQKKGPQRDEVPGKEPNPKKCLECEKNLNEAKEKVKKEPDKYQLIPESDYGKVCSHDGRPSIKLSYIKKCPHGNSINREWCNETVEEYSGGSFLIKKTPCKYHGGDQKPNNPQSNNNSTIQLLNQLEQIFIQNHIKLAKRENNKLIIEFDDNQSANNSQLTTQQQSQINSYLLTSNQSSLNLEQIRTERERERERESKIQVARVIYLE